MSATAFLKNYRQTPRKVRLVADLVKGKTVEQAVDALSFMPKRAGLPLAKLLKSALRNAGEGAVASNFKVSDIRVDKGIVLKRSMPRARGSAAQILKRMSHIRVVISPIEVVSPKKRARAVSKKPAAQEVSAEPKK